MMLCYKIVSYRHQVNSVCLVFVKFKMANELKRFCVFVTRCHVLIRLANENNLSGVALAAEFINSKLQRTIMFSISCLSSGNNCHLSTISEKHTTGVSLKSCFKMGISTSRLKISTSSE